MTRRLAPTIAIACGGTGGHLFPGLAVAEQLVESGCAVTLLISPKEVDQQAVKAVGSMGIGAVTLPAVGLSRGRVMAFARGFLQSYRAARTHFRIDPPQAAIAMGGFTSAPPILAAKRLGARTYLHESNTIPGKSNRWLSWVVDEAFVGFPQAKTRLHNRRVTVTGTPVRLKFHARDAAACREALGLSPSQPVLFVTGGSQGATGVNDLVCGSLPELSKALPDLQLFHLVGPNDAEKIRRTCASVGMRAVVHTFFSEMELALGAATVAISRAGASSLAELAAMRVPAVLIPYPLATDAHQLHNARAFEQTGAARVIEQKKATPEELTRWIVELAGDSPIREKMRNALAQWHKPKAAEEIAKSVLKLGQASSLPSPRLGASESNSPGTPSGDQHHFSIA